MSGSRYLWQVALCATFGWQPLALGSDEPGGEGSAGNAGGTGNALAAWLKGGEDQRNVLARYCEECHNAVDWAGGVAFDVLSLDDPGQEGEVWEEAIRKVRAGMMPPQGAPRPDRAVLDAFVHWLGDGLDLAWEASPHPGAVPAARLNRAQYGNAVRDILHFDASALLRALPADAAVGGFDNNAQALSMSPTLLEGYLSVAMQISRQAVGDLGTAPTQVEYRASGGAAQQAHIEGLPLGTRGGMLVEHHFPVDAEYEFQVAANIPVAGRGNDQGRMIWCGGPRLEVMFNGAALPVEDAQRFRLKVPAGTHRIGLALVDEKRCIGAGELLLADANGSGGSVQGLEIDGPYAVSGKGDTLSRKAIFVCTPAAPGEEQACARQILSRLASLAYRRPLGTGAPEIDTLMRFYEASRTEEGADFESGIQGALTWLLMDPKFLYRFEEEPGGLQPGQTYRISDLELASRLSFFLWNSVPDEPLLQVAAAGRLSQDDVLLQEVARMLADPRAQSLVENFASQWLKLRELEQAVPQDAAFDASLRDAMRQETLLFFQTLVREDSNLLGLLDSDFTFVNERLAAHYGMEGVRGSYMRRVDLPEDSVRRGLLGQGSILTATSVANRTSPVIRGSWIVENLLGAHVPSPPPGVETDLDAGAPGEEVQADTLRQRLELHRADPACASCHQIMDPIGFSLENFDLVGRWRSQDNGLPINTLSEMVDGTRVDGPVSLRAALLSRPEAFMASISERLLTYALGRELDHHDAPVVRQIVRQAEAEGFTWTGLVRAIVRSAPFQQRMTLGDMSVSAAPTSTGG